MEVVLVLEVLLAVCAIVLPVATIVHVALGLGIGAENHATSVAGIRLRPVIDGIHVLTAGSPGLEGAGAGLTFDALMLIVVKVHLEAIRIAKAVITAATVVHCGRTRWLDSDESAGVVEVCTAFYGRWRIRLVNVARLLAITLSPRVIV